MANADATVRVLQLRMRGGQDTPARRLRLGARLGPADLSPPGLRPSAVLIVRRLRSAQPAPGAAWERAARAKLAELASHAARPRGGQLAGTPEAVLFADEGELLACLACDIHAGVAGERWWWRSYLRAGAAPPAPLALTLVRHLEALPAAFHYLATWGRAGPVVGALAPAEALSLLTALARRYDAPALVATPVRAEAGDASLPASRASSPGDAAPLAHPQIAAPWDWAIGAGIISGALAPAHRALLGVALLAHHRPATLRSAGFSRAFAAWWASVSAPAPADRPAPPTAAERLAHVRAPAATLAAEPGRNAPRPAADPGRGPDARPEAISPTPGQAEELRAAAPTLAASPAGADDASAMAPIPPALLAGDPSTVGATRQPTAVVSGSEPASGLSGSPAPLVPAAPSLAAPSEPGFSPAGGVEEAGGLDLQGGITTGLGGVLFLVNLMLHLDLPASLPPGHAVGPWATLELLARGLLADAEQWASDPLWAALAALDGRGPGEPPGGATLSSGGGAPATFRRRKGQGRRSPFAPRTLALPAAWLSELDAVEAARWRQRGGWLRLWLGEDLPLYDGPAPPGGPRAALAACLGEGRAASCALLPADGSLGDAVVGPALAGLRERLRRWLALVVPFARMRLGRALGLEHAQAQLAAALLERPGLLYVSATHIDLVMRLDSVTLPVRLAGLDRDPGWLADYGRVIKYYFE